MKKMTSVFRSVLAVIFLSWGLYPATAQLVQGMKGATDGTPIRRDEFSVRLDIPDELVPAVMPYVECRNARLEAHFHEKKSQISTTEPSDCSLLRQQALEQGNRILRTSDAGANGDEGRDRVLLLLDQIDEVTRPKSQEELQALFDAQRKRS